MIDKIASVHNRTYFKKEVKAPEFVTKTKEELMVSLESARIELIHAHAIAESVDPHSFTESEKAEETVNQKLAAYQEIKQLLEKFYPVK